MISTESTQSEPNASSAGPAGCMLRVQQAINRHDLDGLAACFAPDYESTFPVHPERAFQGHSQMRANWSQIFSLVPDIQADLLRCSVDGETVWTEWEWHGTQVDDVPFLQRGVTIQGVREDVIVWARLYVEPVQGGGHAIAVVPDRGTR